MTDLPTALRALADLQQQSTNPMTVAHAAVSRGWADWLEAKETPVTVTPTAPPMQAAAASSFVGPAALLDVAINGAECPVCHTKLTLPAKASMLVRPGEVSAVVEVEPVPHACAPARSV